MPVRKIPKNYRNVTGRAASDKAEGTAAFESTLERDFITLLEFSPQVKGFEVQPVTINWIDDKGLSRHYTPDVLVHYFTAGMLPELVEVKYRQDLERYWIELKPRLKAGVRFARTQGWRFKIMSELEIRTPLLNNARFLLPFLRNGPQSEANMELLYSRLRQLGPSTPQSLTTAIFQDEWHRAQLIPTLWYLIAKRIISVDLDQPVTMTSNIWYKP